VTVIFAAGLGRHNRCAHNRWCNNGNTGGAWMVPGDSRGSEQTGAIGFPGLSLDSQDYLCRPPSSCQTQGVLTHQLAPGATTLALPKISSAFFLCAFALQPYSLRAASLWPQSGSYQMTVRLELPHLERWGVDKTTVVCLPSSQSEGIPVPVLSANNPFAKCTATNLIIEGPKVEYDIVCPERGAAKGHAVYAFSADTFSGRIAMVMGAKNMTMTEIQHGRRIGECRRGTSVSAVKF
jgi:hypothetical protein